MIIRNYQPGDEAAQVAIYNEAAAHLPKFKPVTLDELRRRFRGPEFDPATRFYAYDKDIPLGFCSYHASGRISYPWCFKDNQTAAEPLFKAVINGMKQRGMTKVFTAYRADWTETLAFFTKHGFQQAREMLNFILDLVEMPTQRMRPNTTLTPMQAADVPGILGLSPQLVRYKTAPELEQYLCHNPAFNSDSVFVIRNRRDNSLVAAGLLVENPAYADPKTLDAAMPCFRLGAFGTEGLITKKVNGLFSFVSKDVPEMMSLALQLMEHAAYRLEQTDASTLAAQVPSDAPHMVRFYRQHFRRQGGFPVYERDL